MAEDSGVRQGAIRDYGAGHRSVVRSATLDSGEQGARAKQGSKARDCGSGGGGSSRRRLQRALGVVVPVRAAARGKNSEHGGGSRSKEGAVFENEGLGCLFINHLGN